MCDINADAYDWMREQMCRRIPDYRYHYPWWAYTYRWNLRYARAGVQSGEKYVRMELLVPSEEVLLSSYGAWHCVLNRWFFALTEEEDQQWEEEMARAGIDRCRQPLPEPFEERMVASWERIFEEESFSDSTIQATFEQLRYGDVVRITEFTGTNVAKAESISA